MNTLLGMYVIFQNLLFIFGNPLKSCIFMSYNQKWKKKIGCEDILGMQPGQIQDGRHF